MKFLAYFYKLFNIKLNINKLTPMLSGFNTPKLKDHEAKKKYQSYVNMSLE